MLESTLPLPLVRRGKVREVYAAGDELLLLIASDRVSAFDVVLPDPIPAKGAVLTQISAFWFRGLRSITDHHFVTANTDEIIDRLPALAVWRDQLARRAMLCRRTQPLPVECVVRGYLAGSAWAEYRGSGTLAGEKLPAGLAESAALDPPLFSPATKADVGHDENITYERMAALVGADIAGQLRDTSLALYAAGRDRARERGIIIADTKFEFGRGREGELVLIDELLTPDSSRFWPADRYAAGRSQPSFDKQPLRDYLAGLKRDGAWDGDTAIPLPADVVEAMSARYLDAYARITGAALSDA